MPGDYRANFERSSKRRKSCARSPQGQVRVARRTARDFIACGMHLSLLSRTAVLLLISECAWPDIPIPRRTATTPIMRSRCCDPQLRSCRESMRHKASDVGRTHAPQLTSGSLINFEYAPGFDKNGRHLLAKCPEFRLFELYKPGGEQVVAEPAGTSGEYCQLPRTDLARSSLQPAAGSERSVTPNPAMGVH